MIMIGGWIAYTVVVYIAILVLVIYCASEPEAMDEKLIAMESDWRAQGIMIVGAYFLGKRISRKTFLSSF